MTHSIDMNLALSDDEMHLYSRQILLEGWDIDAQETQACQYLNCGLWWNRL